MNFGATAGQTVINIGAAAGQTVINIGAAAGDLGSKANPLKLVKVNAATFQVYFNKRFCNIGCIIHNGCFGENIDMMAPIKWQRRKYKREMHESKQIKRNLKHFKNHFGALFKTSV